MNGMKMTKTRDVKLVFLAILAAIALAGCSSEGVAKDAVKRLLNDPESARFSELNPGKQKGDVCGFVNAKNKMGGYVGDTPFFFEKTTGATGLVRPVADSDFRSLWLSIRAGNFGDDLNNLSAQCGLLDQWESVCTSPTPFTRHRMCTDIKGDGKKLYETLKWEFDR